MGPNGARIVSTGPEPPPATEPARPGYEPPSAWRPRQDFAIMGILAVATFLLYWPLRSRVLYTWDSFLFALALEDYDVGRSQPHPPGYPVFIFLARGFYRFTDDANTALVLVSLLAAVASVALLYGLVRQWGPPLAAAVAAGLFALSPVLFFHGSVALSYTMDALATIGVAWLAWAMLRRPRLATALALGMTWALAVGVRQSLLFFLTPLVVYALLLPSAPPGRLQRCMGAAAAGAVTGLAWFIPMILASGWSSWRMATQTQSEWVVFRETVFSHGWPLLREHLERMGVFLQNEVVLLVPLAILLLVFLIARRRLAALWRAEQTAPLAVFIGVWTVPSILFYLLIFNGWGHGPSGYALVFLPAIYAAYGLLGETLLSRTLEAFSSKRARQSAMAIGVVVLLIPAPILVAESYAVIDQEVRSDEVWHENWAGIRDVFDPEDTAILAWHTWPYVKWYFPEYLLWSYLPLDPPEGQPWVLAVETTNRTDNVPLYPAHREGPDRDRNPIPERIDRVLLFDHQLAGEHGEERRLRAEVTVQETDIDGWRVLYFEPVPGWTIEDHFRPLQDLGRPLDPPSPPDDPVIPDTVPPPTPG